MSPEAAVPAHFSFLSLAANASLAVQAIMAALALASVLCWTIGFEKLMRYAAFSRHVRRVEENASGCVLDRPASWLVTRLDGIAACEPPPAGGSATEFKAAIQGSLELEIAAQMRRLQSGLPVLATVGATAPFVGLFGTVWGIMNSFTGIAAARDTSLATVAPGIAEALLATAIGLAAAIPAVVIYNLANVFIAGAAQRLSHAAARMAKSYGSGGNREEAGA
jgi:biopolymer transport protein ExbB/TolQ